MQQVYICIDLKSFFASVECVERGLDPMTAKLVVAYGENDLSRGESRAEGARRQEPLPRI